MLNTPITPPRVPLIDERTGLIDRSWYMFFLSLFDAATEVYEVDEGAPNTSSLVASYDAAIRALAKDVESTPPTMPFQPVDDTWKLAPSMSNQPQDESWKLAPPIVPITDYGTVTSVAATTPSFLTVTGSPITTSGTLAFDYSGDPLPIAYGGTGASSFSGADLPTLSGNNTFSGDITTTGQNNQFTALTYATTDGLGGVNAYFGESTAYAVIGGVNGVVLASGGTYPGTSRYVGDATSFRPSTTASYSSGTLSQRWTTVYSQNLDLSGVVAAGTWNGSTISVGYGGTGVTSTPSNGQLLIGNGSGYSVANLTAGTNISISNSSGGITISATGSSGTVTSVDGSGGSTGLTLTGGPITTSGTLTLGGTLAVTNGGTGASSLAGAGIVTTTDTQTISGQKNFTSYTNTLLATTYATSDGSSSSNAYLGESGAYAVVGGANGVVLASGATYPGSSIFAGDTNTWRPTADNTRALGTGSFRYTVVYATTGTINTSDATEKQQVRVLSEAEQRVAKTIKGLIRAFKWNDAVQAKGDAARTHIGVMAQDVQAAFAAEGLDASEYGLFCCDTWTTSDGASQTRLGVRYDELLAFVIAAL